MWDDGKPVGNGTGAADAGAPLSRQALQDELKRQSELLQSVNLVATHLAVAEPKNFERLLWEALREIGRAARADRAYIWENYEEDGQLFCRQTYEWAEGAQPVQGEEFTLALPYNEVPHWRDQVMSGASVNGPVRHLPAEERAVLEPQGIVSILVISLKQEGGVWGFIGFDDCHNERVFTKAEEQVLQSAGVLMASAVIRNRMNRRLQGQEKLLRAVNEVAGILISDDAEVSEDFVRHSLQLLAESVGADRSFIWRNSTVNGQLCSSEICEWTSGENSFTPDDETPLNIPIDGFIPEWNDTLLQGKNMNMLVRDMGPEFRNSPAAKGVLTTMNIPLVVHGEFWGIVGFDDMHRERLFTDTEMDILKSGGMLVASAILRNEMVENLIDAKEEALASTRAKSEFLSRMSHEIRTPLNAVIGMATLAHKSADLQRVKYCLDKIDVSSRQLLSIINDILDMSKIESGKFEIYPHEFDFEKMLQHSINVVQVKLDEKHQELVLEMPGAFNRPVISDELRFSQVLINLLTNAIKFTPDFGTITMKIDTKPLGENAACLHVEVKDTGIGISKEQQALLFTSFQQADSGISRQYGGTGLGLAICKKICLLMGGDIWVESEAGQGANFIFEVQVGWGEKLQRAVRPLKGDLRVLVVDDSRDVLDYFSHILEGFGVVCTAVDNGRDAVALAQKALDENKPYELLFVDWMMPGMDGEETARQLGQVVGDSGVVVIISVADHADIEQGMKAAGVRHFLAKPVLPSVLYDTVVQMTDHTLVSGKAEECESKDWGRRRVLLAEDIDINREVLTALLEDTGVQIDCAENGREAVEMFRAAGGAYDLILMDVQMPLLDGFGATRAIRALEDVPKAQTVPIVAMTANAFKEDVQDCLDAGMNAHVAKPVELDVLLKTLGRYLD